MNVGHLGRAAQPVNRGREQTTEIRIHVGVLLGCPAHVVMGDGLRRRHRDAQYSVYRTDEETVQKVGGLTLFCATDDGPIAPRQQGSC